MRGAKRDIQFIASLLAVVASHQPSGALNNNEVPNPLKTLPMNKYVNRLDLVLSAPSV